MTGSAQGVPGGASHGALSPSEDEVELRYRTLVDERYAVGTVSWRSWRTTLLLTPLFIVNAMLPALASGTGLSPVPLEASLGIYGAHYGAFIAASAAFRLRGDIHHGLYRVLNRAESSLWVVGSGAMVGLSGTAASVYWLHVALVVTLVFPMIRAHRPIAILLGLSTATATVLLATTGSAADALFAAMVGMTFLLFHRLSMRTAPRLVRAQANADVLAARATRVLLDAERERIRRELHDNLGAELTSLLWTAEASSQADAREIDNLVARIRSGIAELRVVMQAVAPVPMSLVQLERELKRVVDRLTPEGVHIQMRAAGQNSDVIPGDICHATIRIAQESVRNAIEHGDAKHIDLSVELSNVLSLTVTDDGLGLDGTHEGGGMRGVRERASELGGRVQWRSDSTGVSVQVTLPVYRDDAKGARSSLASAGRQVTPQARRRELG